ncbi:hypothetical protein PIB30_058150 [Stylosanthes scabra]|uniref:Uncharacterized protein n=1 Tax=Stylosanthes scabra TaxID=79078 RepID=A0ABU6YI29_9FABA|nr:hypothetical protein [Stylosanthes scabra]
MESITAAYKVGDVEYRAGRRAEDTVVARSNMGDAALDLATASGAGVARRAEVCVSLKEQRETLAYVTNISVEAAASTKDLRMNYRSLCYKTSFNRTCRF